MITENEMQRLAIESIAETVKNVKKDFPNFENEPLNAQIALVDMGYNLGTGKNGVIKKFPNFTKAMRSPNSDWKWSAAAFESERPQLSLERNEHIRSLLLSNISHNK